MTKGYVWVWRLQNELMDAEPFNFQHIGFGRYVEASYATEEEARAALADVREYLEGDGRDCELVLDHVHRSELEVRA